MHRLSFTPRQSASSLSSSSVLGMIFAFILSACCRGQALPLASEWDIYAGGGQYVGTQPSASPDSRSVVYSTPATGHGDIYRFDRKTGKNVRLSTDPEYDGFPLFLADGKVIFLREKKGAAQIWVTDPDGNHQKQLTDGPTYDMGAALSRDGKSVVFCRMREGVSRLWVMDADGSHPKQLTDGQWFDSAPSFSWDGTRIAFARQEAKRVDLLPVTGAATLRFPEIYVMKSDGTDQKRLTHNLGSDQPGFFTANGKQLIYHREDELDRVPYFWGIAVMDADGANSRDLAEGFTPALSPDGRRVVFGTYQRSIDVMNTDGTGRRTICRSRFLPQDPTFTPDGSHVVFDDWPEEHGAATIKIIELETSKIESVPRIE
jgi:Tol biopolymer transport system component